MQFVNRTRSGVYPINILLRRLSTIHKNLAVFNQDSTSAVKPYSDIPEVKTPYLAKLEMLTGKYTTKTFHELLKDRVEEYGVIYREKLTQNVESVFTANPDDFQIVFNNENRANPPRRGEMLWALKVLNKDQSLPESIVHLDGKEWLDVRDGLKQIVKPNEMAKLVPELFNITHKFCTEYIPKVMENKDTALIKNLKSHLDKWTFECIGMITFRESFGMFKEYDEIDPIVKQIFENGKQILKALLDLETSILGQYNKSLKTKLWRNFENIINGQREALKLYKSKQRIIFDNEFTEAEVFMLTGDVLAAGIDTIAETSMWVTIELSRNADVQDKIYKEVMSVIGNDQVDGKMLQKLQYTRAVMKEVFRVRPLTGIVPRITTTDIVLSGYEIPKGTHLMLLTNFYDKNKYFKDSHLFQPERWIRSQQQEKPHPFTVMTFGEGMRSCPGRRIAENEVLLYIATLMRYYKIEPVQTEIATVYNGLLTAEEGIDFVFHKR